MITGWWWALSGALLGGGLVTLAVGLVGTTAPKGPGVVAGWRQRSRSGPAARSAARRRALFGAALVAGVAVWLVSGVFVVALITAAAVVGVPWLTAPVAATKEQMAKRDALAEWTQRLAEVLRLGVAIEQALKTSRRHAPQALEREIEELVDKVDAGWPLGEAVEDFGRMLDDPTADKVCAALKLSVTDPGPGLAQAMQDMSASLRDEVGARQKIEAEREKSRTVVRTLTFITLALVPLGFTVPQITSVFATLLGQLVLGLLSAAFVAVLVWSRSYATRGRTARVLVPDPRSPVKALAELEAAR
ncbi:type II secretion system F family protein [Streptomyces xanthochromogenes]|uniref:type II secretion system F family protein n=1 Tax=Streptomyces xanthochromogenes TaxID=67384 RepID=UPI00141E0755